MKKYMQLLERLKVDQTLVKTSPQVAVLLSGQSDFEHSEFSTEQKELLSLLKAEGFTVINMGFPYNQDHAYARCSRAPLVVASMRNIQQFFYVLTNEYYRRLIAKHLQPVFEAADDLVIICQSLGFYMLKAALPFLKLTPGAKITLLALGPVAWGRFLDQRFRLVVIKGRGDWVSRIFDRQMVDYWISCQHMNYCQNKQTQEIVRKVLRNGNQS